MSWSRATIYAEEKQNLSKSSSSSEGCFLFNFDQSSWQYSSPAIGRLERNALGANPKNYLREKTEKLDVIWQIVANCIIERFSAKITMKEFDKENWQHLGCMEEIFCGQKFPFERWYKCWSNGAVFVGTILYSSCKKKLNPLHYQLVKDFPQSTKLDKL